MTIETAEQYVPTAARAIEQGHQLPPGQPAEEHRLAALVVMARILRRERWDEEIALSPSALASLSSVPPGQPADMVEADHLTLLQVVREIPCPNKSPKCRGCEGTGRMPIVLVQHHYDRIATMHEVYVPSHVTHAPGMLSFEAALESAIAGTPPECLRCLDLRPQQLQTAYRGGGKIQEPEFAGHSFGDTIERAGNAVMSFARRGKILRGEVKAYAWPFLWLRYTPGVPSGEVALFVGLDGSLHRFAGSIDD